MSDNVPLLMNQYMLTLNGGIDDWVIDDWVIDDWVNADISRGIDDWVVVEWMQTLNGRVHD